MPKSKKGRLSGSCRKELNAKASADAIEGRVDGITFARVTRMLGENHIRVAVPTKHGYKEFMARIPNKLGKKGSTPLTINNVVSIYVGNDFDPDEIISGKSHFDVTCILDSKQAYQLVKDGTIPGWMLKSPEEVTSGVLKTNSNEGDGYEFDYHTTEEQLENVLVMNSETVDPVSAQKKSDKDASGGAVISARKGHDSDSFNIEDI